MSYSFIFKALDEVEIGTNKIFLIIKLYINNVKKIKIFKFNYTKNS